MTSQDFVKGIERYYGAYGNEYKREVVEHFMRRFDDDKVAAIYEQVLLYFSDQYGKVPDVAAIKRIIDEHEDDIKVKTGEIYQIGQDVFRGDDRIGHYDGGTFIPDLGPIQGTKLLAEYVAEFTPVAPNPERYVEFLGKHDIAIGSNLSDIKQIEDKS